jgi:hypothetical protein
MVNGVNMDIEGISNSTKSAVLGIYCIMSTACVATNGHYCICLMGGMFGLLEHSILVEDGY